MIDWAFIASLEGMSVVGYVPNPAGSQSGVTIASGVDLGQMIEASLCALDLDGDLTCVLLPYTGLRRDDAVAALAKAPLRITEAQADALNIAVRRVHVVAVAQRYGPGFGSIPAAAQTVIASVAFQYGDNLPRRCPRFWALAVRQDWPGVIEELRDFHDDYPTRRHREADYLEKGLGAS